MPRCYGVLASERNSHGVEAARRNRVAESGDVRCHRVTDEDAHLVVFGLILAHEGVIGVVDDLALEVERVAAIGVFALSGRPTPSFSGGISPSEDPTHE
jgi:hypothetical protein